MSPEALETLIAAANREWLRLYNLGQREQALEEYGRLARLVRQRDMATVARMEKQKGLR